MARKSNGEIPNSSALSHGRKEISFTVSINPSSSTLLQVLCALCLLYIYARWVEAHICLFCMVADCLNSEECRT